MVDVAKNGCLQDGSPSHLQMPQLIIKDSSTTLMQWHWVMEGTIVPYFEMGRVSVGATGIEMLEIIQKLEVLWINFVLILQFIWQCMLH